MKNKSLTGAENNGKKNKKNPVAFLDVQLMYHKSVNFAKVKPRVGRCWPFLGRLERK